MIAASESPPEASGRSVAWGLFLCVIFSVASAYSGLKVGQVMEAAMALGAGRRRGRKGIRERGVIIASGLMAGGALGGVLGAALRLFDFFREDLVKTPFYENELVSQSLSALLFAGLCAYLWFAAVRPKA